MNKFQSLQILSVLHCVLTAGSEGDIPGPCKLPAEDISLSSLDQTKYYLTENKDSRTRIYLGLCHTLDNTDNDSITKFCDNNAFACVTKINKDGKEEEFIRNAGRSLGDGLQASTNNVGLKYSEGQTCVNGANQTVNYTTNIDFICQQDKDGSIAQSINYAGTLNKCTSQVFWLSSLACLPAQKERVESGSCVLDIPGPDLRLDLSAWASLTSWRAESEPGQPRRSFQLNLCRPAVETPCGNNTMVCEVDDTWMNAKQTIIGPHLVKNASYDELREVITLRYFTSTATVFIEISCDAEMTEPLVRLVHNSGSEYTFSMKTAKACFVPAVHCHAESQSGEVFNFENLLANEWDFTTKKGDSRTFKYQIKVCGSLPISRTEVGVTNPNPCQGQTGICYFEEVGSKVISPVRLGVMSQQPRLNEDGSISMLYTGGDRLEEKNCSLSAEIVFRCHPTETSPQYDSDNSCHHVIHWNTPEACPATKVKLSTKDCTIREPLYSHLFNLTSLHKNDSDYRLSHDGLTFVINPCGQLHDQDCSNNPSKICLSSQTDITYDNGLRLHIQSVQSRCDSGSQVSAVVEMLCHHSGGLGFPRIYTEEEGCRYKVEWLSQVACPPHDVVQCSVDTLEGEVDLSSLSLPHDNYQIKDDEGEEIIINICRSIVHSQKSHCPYKSAACSTGSRAGQVTVASLGSVVQGLQYRHSDRQLYIEYRLGSVCSADDSNRTHLETIIYFSCASDVFDSRPELVEFVDCRYVLQWRHAAACPVRRVESGNCTLQHPETGFIYDLNSLHKRTGNYNWTGSYHHLKGSYEFNVCGGVNTSRSKCGPRAGICDNGTNLGSANRELFIEDGQMYLNYTDGDPCESGHNSSTVINLMCPYDRVNSPSGNYESEHQRYQVMRVTKCKTEINFPTELACDHQVNCEVSSAGNVYSLDKLRRHQDNYHVTNKDPSKPEFVLNICGPLVSADVESSDCNPHSACTRSGKRYLGLGKAVSSPRTGDDGGIELDYRGGDGYNCSSRGDQPQSWRSLVIFTCDSKSATAQHPFGFPVHQSTDHDLCTNTFLFPTVLVCPQTYETKTVSEPDSCKVYHSGISKYIDISSLQQDQPYNVLSDQGETFEVQPCGANSPSCPGAICRVSQSTNYSLGHLADFTYEPALDSIKVNYREGAQCNAITNRRWSAKIYYTCDRNIGLGRPQVQEMYDCVVIFNWRTSIVCTGNTHAVITPTQDPQPASHPTKHDQDNSVHGGTSSSSWFFLLLCLVLLAFFIVLYVKPSAREKVFRVVQGSRARLPVWLGGRSMDDTTLLVSDGRMTASGFGALSDQDDFS